MTNQKRIKVLRVVTTSECIPWHLANTLKRLTKDFDVCVAGQGVSIYRLDYPEIKWVDIELTRKVNIFSDFSALLSLCKLIHQYKPDILHSIMPKAGLICALAGFICSTPVRIHTFTGQVWANKRGLVRLFLRVLDKLIVLLNTVCLSDSPSQSEFLYKNNISLNGKPLPVLSRGSLSGVDIQRFDSQLVPSQVKALQAQFGILDTDFIFAFIARKSLDKGAVDVLRAFAIVAQKYSQAKLLFVGPDESNGEVEKVLNSNSIFQDHVLNIGRVVNHELYLAISDVLCLPSYREGFGSIVIDAAAIGVPTIGSNIAGLVDAIENGKTGILFPVGDIEQLTQLMCTLIESPAQAVQLGERARLRVHKYFTADILFNALKEIYLEHTRMLG
ncbi:MAG: glycosyltransferase [Methylotenera sp.]|uniref:glycosyltransferase n=1 Tax=Methylotenera sp. TaxID=2051956 RepID=UPI0024890F90|nr:glycosyltransferase [Methylotenera sp.]MDI1307809.1 glycosyltransferase [Methylotenera sp.]